VGFINTYGDQGMFEEAKKWCLKLYEKREQVTPRDKCYVNWAYAHYFGTPDEEIKYLRQALEIDDQDPISYFVIGSKYNQLYQYDKAIPEYEKALEIYDKWDTRPNIAFAYTGLLTAYYKTRQYKKGEKLYRKAELDFPGDPLLIFRRAILYLFEGDTVEANRYNEKYITVLKGNSMSEARISRNLADIYSQADYPDKAEIFYRKALSLEPGSPLRLDVLAYFLIDKDRNIIEGMELTDKALKSDPDNYNYLHTKGWGLYKQGKYGEALEILQKSWDLRREFAIYNHDAFLHLEAAKKALASQKKTDR
jgi:tetratricopeptide (TPR) repeat protein